MQQIKKRHFKKADRVKSNKPSNKDKLGTIDMEDESSSNGQKEQDASQLVREAIHKYGSYVISNRAIVDYRDGLKPIHRRILFAMYDMGLLPNKAYEKAARVVGEVIGKYNPHGDASAYQALVGTVHWRYPMTDPQGNWGNATGTDPAAAYRYTETRLSRIAHDLLFEDFEAAEMMKNYDGKRLEPVVLPARLPLSLLVGTQGIAVGISAGIPPHNLKELTRALIALVHNKETSNKKLLRLVPGPDYGEGVCTSSAEDILNLYKTGNGSLSFRCDYHFEQDKHDKKNTRLLVIDGLAPGFSVGGGRQHGKNSFLSKCLVLKEAGLIDGISDESAEKVRLVVSFSDTNVLEEKVLPLLNTRQSYQFYAVTRAPESEHSDDTKLSVQHYSLRELLLEFLDFRRDIENTRLLMNRKRQQDKLMREDAILKAIDGIKILVKLLESNKSTEWFLKQLRLKLKMTKEQAKIVADMPVRMLQRNNRQDQLAKIADIKQNLKHIAYDLDHLDEVVVRTLKEVAKKFGDERKMKLTTEEPRLPHVASSKFVALDEGGTLKRYDDPPTRVRSPIKGFVSGNGTMLVYKNDGKVRVLRATAFPGRVTIKGAVGLSTIEKNGKLLVADEGCNFGCVDIVAEEKKDFQAVKTETGSYSCFVGKKDSVLLSLRTEGAKIGNLLVSYDDLSTKRRNSAPLGTRFIRNAQEVVSIAIVHPGNVIVDIRGKEVELKPGKTIMRADPFFVLGDENLVCFEDGKKSVLDMEKTKEMLRKSDVERVFVL